MHKKFGMIVRVAITVLIFSCLIAVSTNASEASLEHGSGYAIQVVDVRQLGSNADFLSNVTKADDNLVIQALEQYGKETLHHQGAGIAPKVIAVMRFSSSETKEHAEASSKKVQKVYTLLWTSRDPDMGAYHGVMKGVVTVLGRESSYSSDDFYEAAISSPFRDGITTRTAWKGSGHKWFEQFEDRRGDVEAWGEGFKDARLLKIEKVVK